MKNLLPVIYIIIFAIAFSFVSYKLSADEDDLSDLKPLDAFNMISGMRADVKNAMEKSEISIAKIAIAIPSGDFDVIAEEAAKIDVKYAIVARLTPDDSVKYFSLITADFIFMDQNFHTFVGALESSAKEKDLENTLIQFDLTLRSCVDCHYDFAKEKFPKLARAATEY